MRTTYWLAIRFSRVYFYMRRVQQAFHWAQHYVNTEVNMSKLLLQLLPPTRLTTLLLLIKPAAELWGTLFSVLLWWARHVLRFDITTWGKFSQALVLILIFECSSVCVIIFLWGSFEGLFCLHFFACTSREWEGFCYAVALERDTANIIATAGNNGGFLLFMTIQTRMLIDTVGDSHGNF